MAARPLVRPRTPGRPLGGGVERVYEDFRPISEWKEDDESNILLQIFVPGFKTENLKVSTEGRNIIRVRGERPVAANVWSRFQEDFPIPDDCLMRGIRARFEGGILTIIIPKKKKEPQNPSKILAPKVAPDHIPPVQPTPQTIPSKAVSTLLDQLHNRHPTPGKRADDQRVLDDHKLTTKDKQEEKGPIFDHVKQRQTSPVKTPAVEKRSEDQNVLDNSKVIKDAKEIPQELPKQKIPDEKEFERNEAFKGKLFEQTEKLKEVDAHNKIGEKIDETRKVENEETKLYKEKEHLNVAMEKLKKRKAKEKLPKAKAAGPSTSSGMDHEVENYKQKVRSSLEMNEERQLLVNVGVAALVLVALGVHISHLFGSRDSAS